MFAQSLPNIEPLQFDVTLCGQVEQAAQGVSSDLDLIILNAGDCEYINDPMHFDSAVFERVMRVNLLSVGFCLEHLLPKIRKGGRLALMTSSASYLPLPKVSAFGASKAAVNYLANTMRIELQKFEVSVSLICLGFAKKSKDEKKNSAFSMHFNHSFAAKAIYFNLVAGKDEIHFPHIFTQFMKLLSVLPFFLWRRIASTLT